MSAPPSLFKNVFEVNVKKINFCFEIMKLIGYGKINALSIEPNYS